MRNEVSNELSTDINVITAEINAYQRVAGEAIFEIGRRLKGVRDNPKKYGFESYRDWERWCNDELNMTRQHANRFVKVFERFAESGTPGFRLPSSITVLVALTDFTDEELEQTYELPSGEKKKPTEMSRREIEELKKALKEAEKREELERKERERLEAENEQLAKQADKPPEVRTEYVEVKDELAERKLRRYEELFGDVSIYEGRTTRVTNGDAITYTVFEFSEDVRKFIEKYGHLTHFAREFNEMIGEGKEEYRKAIGDMVRFMGAIERNLNEEETIIING